MSTQRKVVLVKRRTRYEELVSQYNTESQAAFVIGGRGQDFSDYKIEHTSYVQAIGTIEKYLTLDYRLQSVDREFLPNFMFSPDDIVLVIGQDGLVANTLKYLDGQPVVAINPDPNRYDGMLLPFGIDDVTAVISDVAAGNFDSMGITMATATLNDGQSITAVNDLFIGPRYQISARYEIEFNGAREVQSSSGLIVSTGLGSTGWLTSVHRGAEMIVGKLESRNPSFDWDSDQLRFAVREPFPSQLTGTEVVCGTISTGQALTVNSQMASHGVIFSDGMIDDFIEFNSGTAASIGLAICAGSTGRLSI